MAEELLATRLPEYWTFGVCQDGRIFFINDQRGVTTWLHPVTGRPVETGHFTEKGLPPGWEQGVTPEGAIYYIDHNTFTTTFDDPLTGPQHSPFLQDSPAHPTSPTSPRLQGQKQKEQNRKSGKQKVLPKAPIAKRTQYSRVVKRSWLYRQESAPLKTWKKRWCVLADFCLHFYKDESEKGEISSIILPSYTVSNCNLRDGVSRRFCLKIEHENVKSYFLATDTQAEYESWFLAIQLATLAQADLEKEPGYTHDTEHNNNYKGTDHASSQNWQSHDYPPGMEFTPQGHQPYYPEAQHNRSSLSGDRQRDSFPGRSEPYHDSHPGPHQSRSSLARDPYQQRSDPYQDRNEPYRSSYTEQGHPDNQPEFGPAQTRDSHSRDSLSDQKLRPGNFQDNLRTSQPSDPYSHNHSRHSVSSNVSPHSVSRRSDQMTDPYPGMLRGSIVGENPQRNDRYADMAQLPQKNYTDLDPNLRGSYAHQEPEVRRSYAGSDPHVRRSYADHNPQGRGSFSDNDPQDRGSRADHSFQVRGSYADKDLHGPSLSDRDPQSLSSYVGQDPQMQQNYSDRNPEGRSSNADQGQQVRESYTERDPNFHRSYVDESPQDRDSYADHGPHGRGSYADHGSHGRGSYADHGPQGRGSYADHAPQGRGSYADHGPHGGGSYADQGRESYADRDTHLRESYADHGSQGRGSYADHGPQGRGSYADHGPQGSGSYADHDPQGRRSHAENDPQDRGSYANQDPRIRGSYADHGSQGRGSYADHDPQGRRSHADNGPQDRGSYANQDPRIHGSYADHGPQGRGSYADKNPSIRGSYADQDPRIRGSYADLEKEPHERKSVNNSFERAPHQTLGYNKDFNPGRDSQDKRFTDEPEVIYAKVKRDKNPNGINLNRSYEYDPGPPYQRNSQVYAIPHQKDLSGVDFHDSPDYTRRISPGKNPGLSISPPNNYENISNEANVPLRNSREYLFGESGPSRPPLPVDMRQQIAEELAKSKTPQTQHDLLIAAENEAIRHQNKATFFQYPSPRFPQKINEQPGMAPRGDGYLSQGQNPVGSPPPKRHIPRKDRLPFDTVKEDPNMADSDVLETKNILSKYPINGTRLRLSLNAENLLGKSHEELVLLLIQLRRNKSGLEFARDFYRQQIERHRASEHEFRRQSHEGPILDQRLQEEHNRYAELKTRCDEIEKKLEVYRPLINLVDNMVTMGSLYGGDNYMLATQYKKHLLRPDQYTPPKHMLEFSRKHQEDRMMQEIQDEMKQLSHEEADLEEKMERLYQLDRAMFDQSVMVTSLKEDKDLLERTLEDIHKQQDQQRDNPRELDRLARQQREIEKELSRVMHQLADASKVLEETTAENNMVEREVALLRSAVYGDLTRSKSAPSLTSDSMKTRLKLEKDLARVQDMMSGLNQKGAKLSQAMNTLRRSSSNYAIPTNEKDESFHKDKTSTYNETDLDTVLTVDIGHNDSRLSHNESRLSHNDSRLGHNDSRLGHNDSRLGQNDSRLGHNDSRLGHNDSRLGHNDSRLGQNDSRLGHNDSRLGHNESRLSHVSESDNMYPPTYKQAHQPNLLKGPDYENSSMYESMDQGSPEAPRLNRLQHMSQPDLTQFKSLQDDRDNLGDDNMLPPQREVPGGFSNQRVGSEDLLTSGLPPRRPTYNHYYEPSELVVMTDSGHPDRWGSAPQLYQPHQRYQSTDGNGYIEGNSQDEVPWDIADADDNTKRFFGLLPKEKPKTVTVRDVKRQAGQRREREKFRRGPEDDSDFADQSDYMLSPVDPTPPDWGADYYDAERGGMFTATMAQTVHNMTDKPELPRLYENTQGSEGEADPVAPPSTVQRQRRNPSIVSLPPRLLGPKPFTPYQDTTASTTNVSNSKSKTTEGFKPSSSFVTRPVKADLVTSSNPVLYSPKSFTKESSGIPPALVKKTRSPRRGARYLTISSSQPLTLETPTIKADIMNTVAGDLIRPVDMVPDIVRSSTTNYTYDMFDENAIERDILGLPEKVFIPERYVPESDDEDLTEEERRWRQERSDRIKRVLTNQSVQDLSQSEIGQGDAVHQKVQEQKQAREHLLMLNQELARQVTLKTRQAAERRKTWSSEADHSSNKYPGDDNYEDYRYNNNMDPTYSQHNRQRSVYT